MAPTRIRLAGSKILACISSVAPHFRFVAVIRDLRPGVGYLASAAAQRDGGTTP
jgi:hypothetical protein